MRHRAGHLFLQSGIEGFGDEVVGAEFETVEAVGLEDFGRDRFVGQFGQGVDGGDLHGHVDAGGLHVQGAAEDVGKAEHVVDLVGIVAAAGGQDHVVAGGPGQGRIDFRIGIGQGEDDGPLGHAREHFRGQQVGTGDADEDVGAAHRVGQGAPFRLPGEFVLPGIDALAAVVHHAAAIHQIDAPGAQVLEHAHGGDAGGAGADADDVGALDVLAGDFQRIEQAGGDDDGGAVLIVVEHGNVQQLAQPLLDLEAGRGGDVLQVDAAEARRDASYRVDEGFVVLGVHLDVHGVDVGEALEQDRLAFHHRLGRQRAGAAETEHRRAVGHHHHQVGLVGVTGGGPGILGDGAHRRGHARGVGQTQIRLGFAGLGQQGAGLARDRFGVIAQGVAGQLVVGLVGHDRWSSVVGERL